jgi:hypothetical protein
VVRPSVGVDAPPGAASLRPVARYRSRCIRPRCQLSRMPRGRRVSARPHLCGRSLARLYVATYELLSATDDFPDAGPMKSGCLADLP